jgi:outer membrane protein OmpA-like peptidoglycan-associated protein
MGRTVWAALVIGAAVMGCSGKAQIKVAAAPPPPAAKPVPKAEPAPEPPKISYLTISDRIQFEPGRAVLLEPSKKVLDEVVNTLAEHADIDLVEIQGHTDWIGLETQNQTLSANRADAVRTYLIARGVTAERLVTHGYGEMKPIADNTRAQGRETNRRVSFKVKRQGGQEAPEAPEPTPTQATPAQAAPAQAAPAQAAPQKVSSSNPTPPAG